MRLIPFLFFGTLVLCGVSPVNGQQGRPTEKEATTAQVVAAMSAKTTSGSHDAYFEAVMGEKTLGFSVSTLAPSENNGSNGYLYRSESLLHLPNGPRIEGKATAHVNETFEPREVELRREVMMPDGKREVTVDRAEIGDKEVSLTRETDGDRASTRSVPRPESPFAFAVEFLIQRVDATRFPVFALREFDPQKGGVIARHFKAESGTGDARRLISREDDGSVGYTFEIDAKGVLVSWTEPPLPVVFKRCSRERIEELRKSLQGR
jgi:hypothetical protein